MAMFDIEEVDIWKRPLLHKLLEDRIDEFFVQASLIDSGRASNVITVRNSGELKGIAVISGPQLFFGGTDLNEQHLFKHLMHWIIANVSADAWNGVNVIQYGAIPSSEALAATPFLKPAGFNGGLSLTQSFRLDTKDFSATSFADRGLGFDISVPTQEDAPVLARLYENFFNDPEVKLPSELFADKDAFKGMASALIETRNGMILRDKGMPCGFTTWAGPYKVGAKRFARISSMTLFPAYKGKGLSKALLRAACLELFSEAGVSTIHLFANPNYPVAVNLYQSFGFKKIENGLGAIIGKIST